MEPDDSHALAHFEPPGAQAKFSHRPHNLMAGNDGRLVRRQLAFHHVQVRPADAADFHSHQKLGGCRLGAWNLSSLQRIGLNRSDGM